MFVQKVTEQGEVAEADVWLKGSLQKPIKPADDDTLFRPVGEYFANISSSPDTFSEEIYSTGRLFFLNFPWDILQPVRLFTFWCFRREINSIRAICILLKPFGVAT